VQSTGRQSWNRTAGSFAKKRNFPERGAGPEEGDYKTKPLISFTSNGDDFRSAGKKDHTNEKEAELSRGNSRVEKLRKETEEGGSSFMAGTFRQQEKG